ncbi:MAG: beta strand repeat-containing protein, partial [Isosphaeraceae bacterium]
DLVDSLVSGNLATLAGGGIFSVDGGVTIDNSTISNNTAAGTDSTLATNPTGGGGLFAVGGGSVSVSGSTIDGNAVTFSNTSHNFLNSGGAGMAIQDGASLTLIGSTVSDNVTSLWGGGVLVDQATASVDQSTFTGNVADAGAGLVNIGKYDRTGGSTVSVEASTFADNATVLYQGGVGVYTAGSGVANLFYPATMTIADSTFTGNSTNSHPDGTGAIYNDFNGTMTVANTTVSDNHVSGIMNNGTMSVLSSTIVAGSPSGNGMQFGCLGILNYNGSLTLGNSIIAHSSDYGFTDYYGQASLTLLGTNLVQTGLSGPGVINADPVLGPLQDNGGPTLTRMPMYGSRAIGAGDLQVEISAGLTTDQRGMPRVVGGAVDLGAVERSTPLPTPPAVLVVSTLADTRNDNFGPGQLSLSEAIDIANARPGPNIITFAPGLTGTIELTSGSLNVQGDVQIIGPGQSSLTIDGGDLGRVISVNGGTATIQGLTVSGGTAYSSGGSFGAIYNSGNLRLVDCSVTGFQADPNTILHADAPGAISNYGHLSVENCTISGNSSEGILSLGALSVSDSTISDNAGAGVEVHGTASVTDSAITNNADSGLRFFGNLYVSCTATLENCAISGNRTLNKAGYFSSYGGGIFNNGASLTVTNCTIAGNSAARGGGIFTSGQYNPQPTTLGSTTLTNVTMFGNTASVGAGAYVDVYGVLTIGNTIIAGSAGSEIYLAQLAYSHIPHPVLNVEGPNLVEGGVDGFPGLITGDPLLAPLGDYGGPTQTMALLPGSPAIGAGVAVSGVTTDQRGLPLDSPAPDIGAFQTNPLVVNTTVGGVVSAPGELSLPQAVNLADALAGKETISFDRTVFATAQTITLTAGQLELSTGTTTITGPAAGVTISGGGSSRVFQVDNGVTASLSGMTITGGNAGYGPGGGLLNSGTATLTDVTVSGNSAKYLGGGLLNSGTATLTDVTVSGNSAKYLGGGLDNKGTATLTGVTVSGNSAKYGGGLLNYGTATLTGVTVSGNSAKYGGGLENFGGTATLTDAIVAGNGNGGGGGDIGGKNVDPSSSYNLIGTGGSGGLSNGVNHNIVLTGSQVPGLAPLGWYGGPTQTMALLPGSPAIGAGVAVSGVTTDQRGAPRPGSGPVDIGAFEQEGYTVAVASGSGQSTIVSTAFPNPLVAVLTEDYAGAPIPGASLTFTAPTGGASAALSAGSATTDAHGDASVSATANATAGGYTVTASTAGVAATVNFSLTNLSPGGVTGVSSITPDGTYGIGATIAITVGFSGAVTVTGTPQLALNSGGTASYSGGSGTATLTFVYTVAAGQNANPLDEASAAALTLHGGTISIGGGLADLTLPAPGAASSLGVNKAIVIDAIAPQVVSYSVLFGHESYDLIGSSRYDLPWMITGIRVVFSKPIAGGDVNSLTGLSTTGFSGLGSNTLTWSIKAVSKGSLSTLLAGSGTDALKDAAGNPLAGGTGFAQAFRVLYGDVNGDGVVSSADMLTVYRAIGTTYDIFDDLDGDGMVDMTDVLIARKQIGAKLS